MKIAVTGKGGVGKSTIVGLMARFFRDAGKRVIVVDADPDMNMSSIMGIPDSVNIIPITELKETISERTGTKTGRTTSIFKMNPRVDDIPEKYCVEFRDIKLLVMGSVNEGGRGCACPENSFIRQLISHLVILRHEVVIMDMEAGIEHLGRGTASAVDRMLIIVEPGKTSVETAHRIKKLSNDIGIKKISVIGNKVQEKGDLKFIQDNLKDYEIIGYIDYSEEIRGINLGSSDVFDVRGKSVEQVKRIVSKWR